MITDRNYDDFYELVEALKALETLDIDYTVTRKTRAVPNIWTGELLKTEYFVNFDDEEE